LVLALISVGLMSFTVFHLEMMDTSGSKDEETVTKSFQLEVALGWFFTTLVVAVLLLITSIILIIAVHKDSRFFMLPWVVITILMVVMDTAALIFDCVIFGMLTLNIIQMVIWLALTLLNIYSVLCVLSQYQELKAGRGTIDYLRSQRATIIYRPAIQEVHITQGPIMMAFPGTITSTTQVQQGEQGATGVTATVTMTAPPDYNVVSDLPRYSATASQGTKSSGTDLTNFKSSSKCDEEASNTCMNPPSDVQQTPPNTPPPPYGNWS